MPYFPSATNWGLFCHSDQFSAIDKTSYSLAREDAQSASFIKLNMFVERLILAMEPGTVVVALPFKMETMPWPKKKKHRGHIRPMIWEPLPGG
jgi:RNase H-fold protein (predicted Holliday junction resolvase)